MSVPCSWQPAHVRCKYIPVCSLSPKFDGLVILPPDTIFLYSAMYVDPVRLSVTEPLRYRFSVRVGMNGLTHISKFERDESVMYLIMYSFKVICNASNIF